MKRPVNNAMRGLRTTPGAAYADMERVAVLGGMAPAGEGSRETPANRWSAHPDGYRIRYQPSSYSQTRIQIWVAAGAAGVG